MDSCMTFLKGRTTGEGEEDDVVARQARLAFLSLHHATSPPNHCADIAAAAAGNLYLTERNRAKGAPMDGQTTDGRTCGRRMPRGRKEGIRIAGGFAQQMAAPLAAQMERKEATDGPQIKLCSLCGHRRPQKMRRERLRGGKRYLLGWVTMRKGS